MSQDTQIRTRASLRIQNKSIVVDNLPTPRKSIRPAPRKSVRPPAKLPIEKPILVEENEDLLIGREIELDSISKYINQFIKEKSGSIYISGAPGTGKTASVLQVIRGIQKDVKIRHFLLNCMKLDSPPSIIREVARNISSNSANFKGSIEEQFDQLEKLFDILTTPLIIILDEIDQLASKHHQMLYKIFDWPKILSKKVIVIGIANSLDLTERLLPKLFISSHRPHHIAFAPYNPQEISRILNERLKNHAENVVFDNFSLQMCARNVSASSGDLRKAFTICYRALDMARQEFKSTEKENNTPKIIVTIRHIKNAIRESETAGDVLQQSSGGAEGEQANLPLHHKLILASLVLLKNRRTSSEFPLGLLHETYQSVCQSQKISPVSMADYASICDLMDSRGLVRITVPGPKSQALSTPSRLKKIALKLDIKGVTSMMDDRFLLSSIMDLKI